MKNNYLAYINKNIPIRNVCEKLGIQVFSGRINDKCNCPFHNDIHPSMVLFSDSNIARCFSCNHSWNNLDFVAKKLDKGFDEAIKWFEKEFPETVSRKNEFLKNGMSLPSDSAYNIAYRIYSKMTDQERVELEQNSRGFDTDFLEIRGVFFSSASKLRDSLKQEEDIEEISRLRDAELLFQVPIKDRDIHLHYEDYYNCSGVIVTIRDTMGNIAGFAQRIQETEKRKFKSKYRFTKKLQKNHLLYRFHEVKVKLSQTKEDDFHIYLVEGIFDALRLEQKGKMAVAVLGSHLTEGQALELEKYLPSAKKTIFLHIFMDNDEAGRKGNYKTLQNLWKSSFFRNTYIDIIVPHDLKCKDPDEYYSKYSLGNENVYVPIDFLTRYFLGDEFLYKKDENLKERYERADIESKIRFLDNVSRTIPQDKWKDVFKLYEDGSDQETFFTKKIQNRVERISEGTVISENEVLPEHLACFQRAARLAKASYDKESLPLDCVSWDRIDACADAFFQYFQELFSQGEHIHVPLLTMCFPKKIGEERKKAMFIHERLIMQQYILNELLSLGYGGYESYIPAVRYVAKDGGGYVYTTGLGYQQNQEDTVSFAYQINMDSLNDRETTGRGIFRNYYDCWKGYIEYIQEGIELLETEKVYRIKLDIQKFYDNIPRHAIRGALTSCLKEGLKADNNKFALFRDDKEDTAERVVSWILEEIYEPSYYDAETGRECAKENIWTGIPQGPDLSAYLADIVLFDLDQRILDYVKKENENAKEGKIRVRYARYVDDMVIISCNAEILINIKSMISQMLFEIGLSLSPKTDRADYISKEDAYDWTTSERGGLGVSAVYDFADDTLDNLLDEYEEYEVTDRRKALQLMRSITCSFSMIEDMEIFDNKGTNVVQIFFQMAEVKFQDIIRISELLLYFAGAKMQENGGNLWKNFLALWNSGKKNSSPDSLFYYDTIEEMAFIEACNRALKRRPRDIRSVSNFKIWRTVQENIRMFWGESQMIRSKISHEGILRKNCWIIQLRLAELLMEAGEEKRAYEDILKDMEEKNEYSRRWIYGLIGNQPSVFDDVLRKDRRYIKDENILYAFHFVTAMMPGIQTMDGFQEIKTLLINSGLDSQIALMPNRILGTCMRCWFYDQTDENDSEVLRISLLVLLNCLRSTVKAEIISQIEPLKKYAFASDGNSRIIYMPVVQGTEYPGLIAMEIRKKGEASERCLKRIEFVSNSVVIPEDNWVRSVHYEKMEVYLHSLEEGVQSLEEYFKHEEDDTQETAAAKVIAVYEMLWKCIKNIQDRNPGMRLVLSKRNVLLMQREGNLTICVAAYLVKQENSGEGVMLERGNGTFGFKPLCANENYFWQAGSLLKDACGFETVRLEYLSGEKNDKDIQIVQMMEYTFYRLTGVLVNRKSRFKGIHSYQKSVNRTVKRVEMFLEEKNHREILLEDNRIMDSFIHQRLDCEDYEYAPAVCSYYVGVWAKNYLRRNYAYLMRLVSEEDVQKEEIFPERRVPKMYLFLANCVENIRKTDKDNVFWGFRVLEAGLRANAVLLHLRMQVLEWIESLEEGQRKILVENVGKLPWESLGLNGTEDTCVGCRQVPDILIRLLHRENEKEVSHITHIGWLLILEWLLESENRADDLTEKLETMVQEILKDSEGEEEFPFEHMAAFFDVWSHDKTEEKLQQLLRIDEAAGITVEKKAEEDYYQEIHGKRAVTVNLDRKVKKPYYFLTFSKLPDAQVPVEQDIDVPDKKCYTQSRRGGKIVGVSTVENAMGQMLQRWEKSVFYKNRLETEEHTTNVQRIEGETRLKERLQQPTDENCNGSLEEEGDLKTALKRIKSKQDASLAYRKKEFEIMDRIAFFQFEAECSYYHPSCELCKAFPKDDSYGCSCHEFRRRKLLEEVFKICDILKVEILLLPEYSVRPETVIWMYDIMIKASYHFSVWAGTFRIPYDYKFDKTYFPGLDGKSYYHAAVLPVISKNKEKTLDIICKHFKKYPSIALEEDINSYVAVTDNYKPVMRGISDYGEARSHVTELICAELFALSSPGNLVSFGKETFKQYLKYMPGKYKPKDIPEEEKKYLDEMLKDIHTYGEAISLYRDNRNEERKSILLVPACTTRAVDYYVIGQANYLGNGGSMVFCNGIGNGMNGGSCFVGQDSWDDRNLLSKSEFKGKTSVYHGINPGIFMQTLPDMNRGALGKKEQALVVCDVVPDLDRRKPNPESMRKALELVAHIPILEHRTHGEECFEKCFCKKDIFLCPVKAKEEIDSKEETLKWIRAINDALDEGNKGGTTGEDARPQEIADNLVRLGEKYNSEWLKERGRQYAKGHRLYPRHWIPETAVDWRYVEIDYKEFIHSVQEEKERSYSIQMPEEKR